MNLVIRHIEYLISRNDCVIIPGLGAVLAHYESARYDAEGMEYLPPRRVFSFNSANTVKLSDGSLENSIARQEHISIAEASAIVKDQAAVMARQLQADGSLSLGRIGNLKYDSESGTPIFESFGDSNLSVATAGLNIVRNAVDDSCAIVRKEAVITPRTKPWVKIARIAASLVLLLGIGFIASTPIMVNEATLASLMPEIKTVDMQDILPSDNCLVQTCESETNDFEISSIEAEPVEQIIAAEPISTPYLIIVASFSTEADAEKYMSQTQTGIGILEKDGRYRVYSDSFPTQSEAYAHVAQMGDNANAWVCKR